MSDTPRKTWSLAAGPGRTANPPYQVTRRATAVYLTLNPVAGFSPDEPVPPSLAISDKTVHAELHAMVLPEVLGSEVWARYHAAAVQLDAARADLVTAKASQAAAAKRIEDLESDLAGADLASLRQASADLRTRSATVADIESEIALLEPATEERRRRVLGVFQSVALRVRSDALGPANEAVAAALAALESAAQAHFDAILAAHQRRSSVMALLHEGSDQAWALIERAAGTTGSAPASPAPRADGPGVRIAPVVPDDMTPGVEIAPVVADDVSETPKPHKTKGQVTRGKQTHSSPD